jgi:hypothetical protein
VLGYDRPDSGTVQARVYNMVDVNVRSKSAALSRIGAWPEMLALAALWMPARLWLKSSSPSWFTQRPAGSVNTEPAELATLGPLGQSARWHTIMKSAPKNVPRHRRC